MKVRMYSPSKASIRCSSSVVPGADRAVNTAVWRRREPGARGGARTGGACRGPTAIRSLFRWFERRVAARHRNERIHAMDVHRVSIDEALRSLQTTAAGLSPE